MEGIYKQERTGSGRNKKGNPVRRACLRGIFLGFGGSDLSELLSMTPAVH